MLGEPQVGVDDDASVLDRHSGIDQPCRGTDATGPHDGGCADPLSPVEDDGPRVGAFDACLQPDVDAATAQRGLGVAAEPAIEAGQQAIAELDDDHAHALARDLRVVADERAEQDVG
jgi:hypothetical protein